MNFDYPWRAERPQGCFVSGDNGRVHFNKDEGGGFQNGDRVICVKSIAVGGILFLFQHHFSPHVFDCIHAFYFISNTFISHARVKFANFGKY